ncbi:MAG: sialate O-acetylesterase [Muribaculaceae bacterium]|nr:sialate O-acetylesterase [Muribaculaceae bacterium]
MKRTLRNLLLAATAVTGCNIAADATDFGELYGQRASLFDALGTDSTSIVMLGNSLTHGCEWHELFGMPNIVNRGINGDIIEGIDNRLDGILRGHPAKIFLLAGVNDVSHNLSADSIATAIDKLVGRIITESPTTKIYLQSLLPINNSFGRYKRLIDKESVILDINVRLEDIAAKHGITWINLYPKFCDKDSNLRKELTNDGLHLLAPGYLVWRDILLPYIKE